MIYIAGKLGYPADALLINACTKKEAIKIACKKLNCLEEDFRGKVKREGDFIISKVFLGDAIRPNAKFIDPYF